MKRWALLGLLALGPRQDPGLSIIVTSGTIGQLRFLYQHMRTEFAGCLYGVFRNDSAVVRFFVPSSTDPRLATDSNVYQGRCADISTTSGDRLLAIFHSHIRYNGGNCYPSGFDEPKKNQPHKDRAVLMSWRLNGALFGILMCAAGDTIVAYNTAGESFAMAVPPLDSLYKP